MPPSRIRPALLTPAQRLQFTAFPDLTEHLIARYYTLTDEELTWVLDRRRDANRLGFAVQLTVLKHLGRGLDVGEIPPEAVLACLGEQLNIDPAKFDVYARRDATRREHFGELCDQLGYRALSVDLNRALRAWLIPMAVATPQPFALMSALLDELRRRKILVPRISVLERIVTQARTQAEQAVHHLLGEIVAGHEDALDALLQVPQDHAMAPYTRLKQWPSQAKPSNFLKLIERLHFVRQFPVNDGRLAALPESRLSGLAAEGKRLSAASLAEYAPAKRRAVIFARLVDVAQTLTDDLLDMHDRLMLTYLRESERASMQEYQASGQALVERLQTFEQVCAALVHARTEHLDPYQAVERVLPWGQLVASVNDHDAAQHLRQLDPLQHLARSFQRVIRTPVERFAKSFNPSGCENEQSGFRTWSWQSGEVPDCQRNKRNPYQNVCRPSAGGAGVPGDAVRDAAPAGHRRAENDVQGREANASRRGPTAICAAQMGRLRDGRPEDQPPVLRTVRPGRAAPDAPSRRHLGGWQSEVP
ncbi:transposase Tn3 family protein [Deinococcus grandis]|uniref:Transposase Tn3 family protein n=1 Tax=Deinococcus grandis TaxID=57498 RepID=A0A117DPI0_9DEIO|nr:DUF4158 domain-containing protein [Deinococcus grandis]BBN96551.1 hypothetical protein DEGR_32840 [Deinococcus grandis]GAQ23476.1 transposase Tn3 family protein [Deinococcus grandis]